MKILIISCMNKQKEDCKGKSEKMLMFAGYPNMHGYVKWVWQQ